MEARVDTLVCELASEVCVTSLDSAGAIAGETRQSPVRWSPSLVIGRELPAFELFEEAVLTRSPPTVCGRNSSLKSVFESPF